MHALTTQPHALTTCDPNPIDRNPAAVYLAGLSQGSRRTMREGRDTIAGMLTNGQADAFSVDWASLRFQHTAAIRASVGERYAPATANKMLSALRGVLKAAWRLSLMSAEDYQGASDIAHVTGSTLPAGRALASGEIVALLEACAADSSPAGIHDGAIIALLRAGGLRRAEVCRLDLSDFNPDAGTLIVKGRRNKDRELPIVNGMTDALADRVEARFA